MMQGVLNALNQIEGTRFLGDPTSDARLASFVIEGVHSADLGAYLNEKNVAVRVGKMCAHPLLEQCGIDSAVRASIGLCTDQTDIDKFADALTKAVKRLR
jgi:cysteine sulfinate desulfinase